MDYVGDKFKQTSTLTFSYKFEYANDTVFFAHFVPYTYSDLERYLTQKFALPEVQSIARIDGICNTFKGNVCYGLTITNDI